MRGSVRRCIIGPGWPCSTMLAAGPSIPPSDNAVIAMVEPFDRSGIASSTSLAPCSEMPRRSIRHCQANILSLAKKRVAKGWGVPPAKPFTDCLVRQATAMPIFQPALSRSNVNTGRLEKIWQRSSGPSYPGTGTCICKTSRTAWRCGSKWTKISSRRSRAAG
jgi:hypothetical protein